MEVQSLYRTECKPLYIYIYIWSIKLFTNNGVYLWPLSVWDCQVVMLESVIVDMEIVSQLSKMNKLLTCLFNDRLWNCAFWKTLQCRWITDKSRNPALPSWNLRSKAFSAFSASSFQVLVLGDQTASRKLLLRNTKEDQEWELEIRADAAAATVSSGLNGIVT